MVDPGIAQVIVKRLNQWYRSRSKPRGTMDHYHRGTRMSFNTAYRAGNGVVAVFLLAIAAVLYLVPDLFADKSPWVVLAIKIGWAGIVAVAVLAPLQALREFVVVNDDGLVKSNLFGKISRMSWQEIAAFQTKADDNKVTLVSHAKGKLTMSLCYNGWQDFLEMAEKRLNPALYWQVAYALADIKAKDSISRSTKKPRPAKWFSIRRNQ